MCLAWYLSNGLDNDQIIDNDDCFIKYFLFKNILNYFLFFNLFLKNYSHYTHLKRRKSHMFESLVRRNCFLKCFFI
jgi:hypothetical protein